MTFKQLTHLDALSVLVNEQTGMGTAYDPVLSTQLGGYLQPNLSNNRDSLDYLYSQSWQCRRVVDYFPLKMGYVWGHLLAEQEQQAANLLASYLKTIKRRFIEGQRVANLYGGACVVRFTDDSSEWSTPLNINTASKIEYSRVFDKWEIYPDYEDIHYLEDPYHPEFYRYVSSTSIGTQQFELIHSSRIIRFRGAYLPPKSFVENGYWEDTVLSIFLEPYLRYSLASQAITTSLKSFNIPVFKIKQLAEKLVLEMESNLQRDLKERMAELIQELSANKGLVLDLDNEDVSFPNRNFANVNDLLTTLREEMIASSGLTKPQFFQEHPSGLAATGESERLMEALEIKSKQQELWEDLLLTELHLLRDFHQFSGDIDWEWNTAITQTDKEKSQKLMAYANVDKAYIDLGVYCAAEVRNSRFHGAAYNEEITLNDALFEQCQKEKSQDISNSNLETPLDKQNLNPEAKQSPDKINDRPPTHPTKQGVGKRSAEHSDSSVRKVSGLSL